MCPDTPLRCPGDTMIIPQYTDNTGTNHQSKLRKYPQFLTLMYKTQISNHAKRKRCYDVLSLWRMKQEPGHPASGC